MDKMDDLEHKRLKDQLPPVVEDTGVNTRAILKFCIGLVIVAAVVHLLIWVVFNYFDDRRKAEDIEISPLAPKTDVVPPEPRLQAMPNNTDPNQKQIFEGLDTIKLQNTERQNLNSYGWIDKEKGVVRIPLDRAIDIFLEKQKLPLPQQSPLIETPAKENAQTQTQQ